MTLTKKIKEEFEKIYSQGGFYMRKHLESFLLSSLRQIATEAIEAVKLEKREYDDSYRIGYNFAITVMEQKAKKFLEDNF